MSIQLTRWSGREGRGLGVDHLELEGGQFAEGSLSSAAVVGPFEPGHDRESQFVAGGPPTFVEDVVLEQAEEALSIAALSPAAPTRPIDPVRP